MACAGDGSIQKPLESGHENGEGGQFDVGRNHVLNPVKILTVGNYQGRGLLQCGKTDRKLLRLGYHTGRAGVENIPNGLHLR